MSLQSLLGTKQQSLGNVLGITPKLQDILGVSLEQSFNQAQPLTARGIEMPFRGTPQGIITKQGDKYSSLGFGMGTVAGNAKAPSIRVGKNLFKGLTKGEAQGWLKWAAEKGIKTKIGK